jgi:hypothetical protein
MAIIMIVEIVEIGGTIDIIAIFDCTSEGTIIIVLSRAVMTRTVQVHLRLRAAFQEWVWEKLRA